MKEFPVSETAMIRLNAMVRPILYAIVPKQLEDSSDPFPVAEFMFADPFTAKNSIQLYLIRNRLLLKFSCSLRSLDTADVDKNQ